ncbi:MFS transporter [Candidatus Chlorohelix sp.]|uniref:MFS transporter n=1 Tax=Candidatus Chlorohelix sp. TaxID=3139201 RepID=UPI00314536A2
MTLGILLCPLNSSMISVAITKISGNFEVNLPTTTWLISGFYIGTVVCQPLMGRLADLFGPRRIFCAGMILVFISGSIAPFVPSFSLVFD